ncbi:MLO-like protein 11 [Gossypium australe]|uniref:MLO-like protein n=1 Tax=Gossypium australe TaxID=47621 RepID=A0A5B6VRE0_9ROSI|nr:MLO-like protein 11 [Gossypium australe]
MAEDEKNDKEMRSLALTPTWSVATVLTIFVVVSLIVERSIHRLSKWLRKTNRKPLLSAVEKMKEELMLLGFISLLLIATSSTIANICIPSKFYDSTFAPCTKSEIDEDLEDDSSKERKLLTATNFHLFRRMLNGMNRNTCAKACLEQLHRFIFVMAITHVSYSCLTMLLAIVKIHSWRAWEDEAHMDRHDMLNAKARELIMRRQTAFVINRESNNLTKNSLLIWVKCFFQQFGYSVVRADYLTLRKGFIMNHNLTSKYDFHGYMIRSMEEEFQRIVGVRQVIAPLWGFVVAFMLFNVKGSNLYFWIAILPITLVLLVGAKLQHVIATLALETADMTGYATGAKLRPRDELFWFKKPEWLLSLIHFILFQVVVYDNAFEYKDFVLLTTYVSSDYYILFLISLQNAFELASFFWFWWQFGYDSCFIRNHTLVYIRLILGFAGQFICSYITLPLYALVTQMGTNYKAALIPQRIRETIHGWGKAARRKRRLGRFTDDSTIHTETSTVMSLEEDDHRLIDIHEDDKDTYNEVELQPPPNVTSTPSPAFANENSSRVGTPLLRPSSSVSASTISKLQKEDFRRSSSMPK